VTSTPRLRFAPLLASVAGWAPGSVTGWATGWATGRAPGWATGRATGWAPGWATGFVWALVACTPASAKPPPAPPPVVTAPLAAPPLSEAPEGAIRTLYADDWFGAVTLVGVDVKARRAILRLESGAPPKLAVDTIDLAAGTRVERWEATPEKVGAARGANTFRPLTDGFEKDLARFATKLRTVGPWSLRGTPLMPVVVVADDARSILYGAPPSDGTDGDWLYVVDGEGRHTTRIDVGMRASYAPVFAPDGTRIAFRGCTGSPCDYGLYVANVPRLPTTERLPRPRRIGSIALSKPPVWSKSGLHLYGVGVRRRQVCLFRAGSDKVGKIDAVACSEGRDPSFAQDPAGRTGAFCSTFGKAGEHVAECAWIELDSGQVLARRTIDRGVGAGALSASGLFAVPLSKGGVAVVDFVAGKEGRAADAEGWFSGFDTTQWIDDEVVLLRKPEHGKGIEIVALDGRKTSG